MRREHCYYVYMVQSASRRALYIGMTSNLIRIFFRSETVIRLNLSSRAKSRDLESARGATNASRNSDSPAVAGTGALAHQISKRPFVVLDGVKRVLAAVEGRVEVDFGGLRGCRRNRVDFCPLGHDFSAD